MVFNFRITHFVFVLSTAALLLSGCSFSLAGDITPPPGYQTPTIETTAAVILPASMPDLQQGSELYTKNCAACHGTSGAGSGPQASKLSNQPTALNDPAIARTVHPVDWFRIVTNGNMEKMMPPFSGSLSNDQRWDVVAYAISLSHTSEQLAEGQAIYAQRCADCHGKNGAGDGSQAAALAARPVDWIQPAVLMNRSDQELANAILNGQGSSMPAYSSALSQDQALAAAAYLRKLAQPASNAVAAAAEPTAATNPRFRIMGYVWNASNGNMPNGLKVTLKGYDNGQQTLSVNTILQTDDSFDFENVEIVSGRIYVVAVEYEGITFYSDTIQAADVTAGQKVDLTVSIYDTTTNTSQLVADRMHIFFDFSDSTTLKVVELFVISNAGNKVVTSAQPGMPLLNFELPRDAIDLQFDNGEMGERFIQTANGFGDTQSILPGNGQQQILFGYKLPYSGKTTLNISLPLPVTAVVAAVTSSANVRLDSDQLHAAGQRTVDNQTVRLYGANDLAAGSTIKVTLSGRPKTGPKLSPGSISGMMLGLGTFAAVVLMAVLYLWHLRADEETPPGTSAAGSDDSVDDLLDQIVALDDLHRAGTLPQDAYLQRRAELKGRLKKKVENREP